MEEADAGGENEGWPKSDRDGCDPVELQAGGVRADLSSRASNDRSIHPVLVYEGARSERHARAMLCKLDRTIRAASIMELGPVDAWKFELLAAPSMRTVRLFGASRWTMLVVSLDFGGKVSAAVLGVLVEHLRDNHPMLIGCLALAGFEEEAVSEPRASWSEVEAVTGEFGIPFMCLSRGTRSRRDEEGEHDLEGMDAFLGRLLQRSACVDGTPRIESAGGSPERAAACAP